MTNITLFTLETAQELYNTSEAFPIDFDMAWQVLGYSTKGNTKKTLVRYFESKFDYIVQDFRETLETKQNGVFNVAVETQTVVDPLKTSFLTVDCFKEMGMLAQSPEGRKIRQYFIQCERIAKQKILEQSEHYQKLLERAALDEAKLEFLKMSERIAKRMGDRSGLSIIRWQIEDHLETTRLKMKPIKPAKLVYPVPDATRTKIFEDLLRACKNRETCVSDLRTHSLGRRLDVLNLYGKKNQKFLRKTEILVVFTDAANMAMES